MQWVQNEEISSLAYQNDTDQNEWEDQQVQSKDNACIVETNLSWTILLEGQFYTVY